jgi:hypothetical protein
MSTQKIGFFGLMKSFDSAESSFKTISGGGLTATVKHELMRGVTIDHLIWWFHNIDQTTTFNGRDFDSTPIDAYKLWHPHDHIKVKWKKKITDDAGHIQPGSVIGIHETFGGFVVNESSLITQFDREGFHFQMGIFGLKIGHLLHFYREIDGGVLYETEMEIKCRAPLIGKLLTWLACRFFATEPKIRAWMQHNIEECGESEKFIPQLYEHSRTVNSESGRRVSASECIPTSSH